MVLERRLFSAIKDIVQLSIGVAHSTSSNAGQWRHGVARRRNMNSLQFNHGMIIRGVDRGAALDVAGEVGSRKKRNAMVEAPTAHMNRSLPLAILTIVSWSTRKTRSAAAEQATLCGLVRVEQCQHKCCAGSSSATTMVFPERRRKYRLMPDGQARADLPG